MDVVTYALCKKYTDSKINVGQFVGTVTNGGSFPTTRKDGSPLQNDDYVKPLSTSTFPFTIGTVTFENKFTQATYLSGTWYANPGAIQDSSEVPIKTPADESISGTKATQREVNVENATAINNKIDKTTTIDQVYCTTHTGVQSTVGYSAAASSGSLVKRDNAARIACGTPVNSNHATTKQYVDDAINAHRPEWGNITGSLASQIDLATALGEKVKYTDVVNNLTSTEVDKPLSAKMGKDLQEQVSALQSMGRFLSTWNCVTGLPESDPPVMPYAYKTGDYYIVGFIAGEGGTNYRPYGASYNHVPSTSVEGTEVHVNDFYQYDGTNWIKLSHSGQTVLFSQIAGNPYDNTNLSTALNEKYVKPSTGIPRAHLAADCFELYRTAAEQDIIDATKVDKIDGKQLSTDDFVQTEYYNATTIDAKIAALDATFRGSFATRAALAAYAGPKTNHDYAYVEADETHSNQRWRYVYDGVNWCAEYRVDGTAEWGQINGDITTQADLWTNVYNKLEVDEKISMGASTFRGAFLNKASLIAYSGEKVKNDYAVVLEDESHANECWRYKYNGTAWISEYRVNETAITTEQWNAMNSGITAAKVTSYDQHKNNINNPHNVTAAQVGLGSVNNTADIDKPVSTATQAALALKAPIATNEASGTVGQILVKEAAGHMWEDRYPAGTQGQILIKNDASVAFVDQYPAGTDGQYLKKTNTGVEWDDVLPTTGTEGQILKKTATGEEFADQYPAGTDGQYLRKTATGVEWDDVSSSGAWEGTKAEYDALPSHDPNTLYCVTDDMTPADCYTKTEADAIFETKLEARTASYSDITLSGGASGTAILTRCGAMRILTFFDVKSGSTSTVTVATLDPSDTPTGSKYIARGSLSSPSSSARGYFIAGSTGAVAMYVSSSTVAFSGQCVWFVG